MGRAALVRAALLLLTDKRSRGSEGRAVAVILIVFIVLGALLCSLVAAAAGHNTVAVSLCFLGGSIPLSAPDEYRVGVERTWDSFAELDAAISALQLDMEDGSSLDPTWVKAVFLSLHSDGGTADIPAFVECFVSWEERTRTVTVTDENGEEVETEERYAVAVPIADGDAVWRNIAVVFGEEVTAEQRANAERVYELVR